MDQTKANSSPNPEPKGCSHPEIIGQFIGGFFILIAALITAYAALVAAGKEPILPSFTSQTSSIEGTWTGTISSTSDDSSRTQVIFFIKSNCRVEQACGTYEIPVLGCKGDLVFNGVTQDVYEFTEKKNINAPDFCKNSTIDRFTITAGDELSVSSLYLGGEGTLSLSGLLTRK